MLGITTLFGGKRKWLFGIVAVLVGGWFLWDYVDAKVDGLETKLQGWQDHAAHLRERYKEQRDTAQRALRSVEELQNRVSNIQAQKRALAREYQEAKNSDKELRVWSSKPLPDFVRDRMRELQGRTPVGGSGETGAGSGASAPGSDPAAGEGTQPATGAGDK